MNEAKNHHPNAVGDAIDAKPETAMDSFVMRSGRTVERLQATHYILARLLSNLYGEGSQQAEKGSKPMSAGSAALLGDNLTKADELLDQIGHALDRLSTFA